MSTEERREVKKKLRREVLARRAALTEPERERGNLLITERILGHQWYYLSDTILGFVSYGSEICTTEILENALQDGKRVYVPKVEGQEMRFYRIQSLAELKEGYKGILEPEGNTESYEYAPEEAANCLLLMPGSVFDRSADYVWQAEGLSGGPEPYLPEGHPDWLRCRRAEGAE